MGRKLHAAAISDRQIPDTMSHKAMSAVLNLNTGTLASRNIRIHKRRTSTRLDDRMWRALNEITALENCSIHDICTVVHDYKDRATGFTNALRVFLMNYYRVIAQSAQVTERVH